MKTKILLLCVFLTIALIGTYSQVPLNGGTISPSFRTIRLGDNPDAFSSTADAFGGTGSYTYIWQWSRTSTTPGTGPWSNITNSNVNMWDPGVQTVSTYWTRRVYDGLHYAYSNLATITINETDLVLSWSFSGNTLDESGNTFTGTESNVYLTSDRFGNENRSYSFWGDSKIYNPNPKLRSFIDNNNPFSVNLWFTVEALGDMLLFACDGENQPPYKRVWIGINNESKISYITFDRYNSATMGSVGNVGTSFVTGLLDLYVWYYLSINYDGKDVAAYLNGVRLFPNPFIGSNPNWTLYSGASMQNNPGYTKGVCVGGNFQNNRNGTVGKLDDVKVYGRSLGIGEILSLKDEKFVSHTVVYDTTDIYVYDSVTVLVYDTTDIYVYDSVTVPVYDTVYENISVTDTLIIDVSFTASGENIEDQIKIYPNPARDNLFIQIGSNWIYISDWKIEVANIAGGFIFSSFIIDPLFNINLSKLARGLYVVKLTDNFGNTVDVRKIILE